MTVPDSDLVPIEEYLRTSYKPACEYIEGVLRQKALPTLKHSKLQRPVARLIDAQAPSFQALPELTLRIRRGKFFVPDLVVARPEKLQDPYPTEPVHLCVEIMSPEDRFAQVVGKCDEYLAWGVPTVWILDPENRRAWQYEGWPPQEVLPGGTLEAGEIHVAVDEIFSVL